jgi:CheY-like chemotaxis protein
MSGVRRSGWRRFSSEPLEVGEPDLDERSDRLLEPGRTRRLECLLVALPCFRRIDSLFETIVSRHEELLDPLSGVVPLHKSTLTSQISPGSGGLLEAAVNNPHKIRVLIADDHRLFSQALEAILATDDRLEVAGHAGDGAEAVQLALSLDPDVILMDIAMPVMDGFQATKQIRKQRPQSCVLMLTGSNARTDVDRARAAGAAGYVTKDRIAAELIDAILEVVSR